MPGFVVNGVGAGAAGQPKTYLTYTWLINSLFGTSIKQSGGDPLIYLRDMTLPTFSVAKEQVVGSSLEYKFAKSVSWDDVKVVWYDTDGLLDVMLGWRKSVWKPDTGLASADSYKRVSILNTVLPTGDSTNTWTLMNSWPSTIRYGDLTYTQSEAKIIDITITYDWAEESEES